ncbi:MAG TPA: HD domain-containing protein, partial [Anaerolineae bacterium]
MLSNRMQVKAENPITLLAGRHTLPLVELYFELNQLKQLYRQGWLRRGVPAERCESVAEHTFGMAMLCMFIADACIPTLDMQKVLRLALLHDFGEIYAGDITPADAVSPEEKHRREREAVQQVFARLPRGAEYLALWQEYEENQTDEARFVKQMDRLEMALQATVYEQQHIVNAEEFL